MPDSKDTEVRECIRHFPFNFQRACEVVLSATECLIRHQRHNIQDKLESKNIFDTSIYVAQHGVTHTEPLSILPCRSEHMVEEATPSALS